ncbi:MAG: O-methyltransferase, partial [Promethearchaeota archaeon]
PKKYQLASQNITSTGIGQFVELIHGDAKDYLKKTISQFNYVFMDCEKEDYLYFFKELVNRLTHGVLIADNVISHADDVREFIELVNSDSRVSSIILPIGKGLALVQWL